MMVAGAWAPGAADASEKPAAPASPEHKVLDRFAGTWDTEASFRRFGAGARDETFQGATTVDWTLGGRFLQWRGNHPGRLEDLQVVTYDPARKAYRHWYFSSEGIAEESTGQWNETTRTMTWRGDLPGGRTLVHEVCFPDRDTQEWKLAVKDAEGKVLVEGHGKLTRRK
jgi:hypothetical protein